MNGDVVFVVMHVMNESFYIIALDNCHLSVLLQCTLCVYKFSLHVQNGQTSLLTAAANDHVEVAQFLLENGSSILERTNVSCY